MLFFTKSNFFNFFFFNSVLFFRPKVGSYLSQLGQTHLKLSSLLSRFLPLMWSNVKVKGFPFQNGSYPHIEHLYSIIFKAKKCSRTQL
nr:MAG TPA: hypothetical protein [Caudoviricetes sp.]